MNLGGAGGGGGADGGVAVEEEELLELELEDGLHRENDNKGQRWSSESFHPSVVPGDVTAASLWASKFSSQDDITSAETRCPPPSSIFHTALSACQWPSWY